MKALSIQQPWAWLIVRPDLKGEARAKARADGKIKDIENRDWSTKRRGWTLVHAGKTIDREAHAKLRRDFPEMPPIEDLQTGGVIGAMYIADCVDYSDSEWFGGDFGFVLTDSKPTKFIPCRGQLSFFEVPGTPDDVPPRSRAVTLVDQ